MANRLFGAITGSPEGTSFVDRKAASAVGVHRPLQAGLSGAAAEGADSIVVSGGYEDGDFVLIELSKGATVKDGDVVYALLNGDPMLKVIRFHRSKAGRMERASLLSHNSRYPPVPVYPNDEFLIVGNRGVPHRQEEELR